MAKVFLGVGHGGADSGAAANGFLEKDLNLAIALACRDTLERHGVNVLMSRTKDETDTLTQEIAECNAYKPDLAIDIHNNAGGGDGCEAFYFSGGGTSKELAKNVVTAIAETGQNLRNPAIKTKLNSYGSDYYGFIRETTAPAVIVECAFVDNRKDMEIIDTEAERKNIGIAVAKGILKTLNIAFIEEKQSGKLYRVQIGAYSIKANAERQLERAKAAGFTDAFITN
jgi:N-acetylmuramoyl-L-alanine amidase